jgi:hypothetical protein
MPSGLSRMMMQLIRHAYVAAMVIASPDPRRVCAGMFARPQAGAL